MAQCIIHKWQHERKAEPKLMPMMDRKKLSQFNVELIDAFTAQHSHAEGLTLDIALDPKFLS